MGYEKEGGQDEPTDECAFVDVLIEWWRKKDRTFYYPWREATDPYRVLVAEILLQRTRRDKVKDVYEEFMKRFPNPEFLANANPRNVEDVIKPLGLRKRGKYLIKMALEFIRNREKIEKGEFEVLPGVGTYIASTARLLLGYDTNVKADSSIARVLHRFFGRKINRRRPADTKWINDLISKCSPTDSQKKKEFLLSLIDLAWEICKPKNPLCDRCPLNKLCLYNIARDRQQ